jgi:hypothetical protein
MTETIDGFHLAYSSVYSRIDIVVQQKAYDIGCTIIYRMKAQGSVMPGAAFQCKARDFLVDQSRSPSTVHEIGYLPA